MMRESITKLENDSKIIRFANHYGSDMVVGILYCMNIQGPPVQI